MKVSGFSVMVITLKLKYWIITSNRQVSNCITLLSRQFL